MSRNPLYVLFRAAKNLDEDKHVGTMRRQMPPVDNMRWKGSSQGVKGTVPGVAVPGAFKLEQL